VSSIHSIPPPQNLTKLCFDDYLCNNICSFTEIVASSDVGPGQEVFYEPNANVVTPVNVPKSNSCWAWRAQL